MKYYHPTSKPELQDLLEKLSQSKCTLLAGGTDLLPRYENGMELPRYLVDLKGIECFSGITDRGDDIEIGSLTTIETIRNSDLIRSFLHALWQASDQFAATQIRNRATIGGNICNASPAGDTLPPLYTYQAQVNIIGPAGEKRIPIADFIIGPGETELGCAEIILSIIIPKSLGSALYYKLGLRRAMAIAVVNFAILADVDQEKKVFNQLTIAAGSVAPTVVYLTELATALINQVPDKSKYGTLIDNDIAPIDDLRATAAYRRKALRNVLLYNLNNMLVAS